MSDEGGPLASVVIQARMSSSRLPGKVAKDLGGKPMLKQLLRRLQKSLPRDYIKVIATSTNTEDDRIEELASEEGWHVVRGPLEDVLGRYKLALESFPARYIVRVTADNPFTDPIALQELVAATSDGSYDYGFAPDMPVGTASEVFSSACIKKSALEAKSVYAREHINAYVYDNPHEFRILKMPYTGQVMPAGHHLTVDTPDDIQFARSILGALANNVHASIADIIAKAKDVTNA